MHHSELTDVLFQSGPYHQDVNMAISEAAEYFSNLHTANRSQVIVFDIDETALSNLPVSVSVPYTMSLQSACH